MIIKPLILIIMRKVMYRCQKSGHTCRSLSSLRSHVEFFETLNHHYNFDGEFICRYVYRAGSWLLDDKFLRRIAVINGRVRFRNCAFQFNRLFAKP